MSFIRRLLEKADLVEAPYRPPGSHFVPSQYQSTDTSAQCSHLPAKAQIPLSYKANSHLQIRQPIKTYCSWYPDKYTARQKLITDFTDGDVSITKYGRPLYHVQTGGMNWITVTIRQGSEQGSIVAMVKPGRYGGHVKFTFVDPRQGEGQWGTASKEGLFPVTYVFDVPVNVSGGGERGGQQQHMRTMMWRATQREDSDVLGSSPIGRDWKLLDVTDGGDGTGAPVLATYITNKHPWSERGLAARMHFYVDLGDIEMPALAIIMGPTDYVHLTK